MATIQPEEATAVVLLMAPLAVFSPRCVPGAAPVTHPTTCGFNRFQG